MFWRSSTLPPPTALFFETNNVCNSRCKTCMKWTEPQAALEMLSVDRCLEIIDEFAEMSPRGRVSLCAAETLLTPERVFPLTRRCRALGLRNHVATNGSLIDELMAESLVLEGAGCVGLSLNSQRADVHDETRGRPGSFSEVTRAVRLLRAARERHGRDTRIHVHAILCEQNYRELEALHQFVLYELGADKLDLAVLQPTFALPAKVGQDRYFAENIVADEEALAETLVRCDRRFGLALNPLWIEQVKMYHRSIREHGDALRGWSGRGTQELICGSYEKNIMIDLQGVARLCFSSAFRGILLERRGDLRRFWRGAADIRRKMKKCREYCGMTDLSSRVSASETPAPIAAQPPRAA